MYLMNHMIMTYTIMDIMRTQKNLVYFHMVHIMVNISSGEDDLRSEKGILMILGGKTSWNRDHHTYHDHDEIWYCDINTPQK